MPNSRAPHNSKELAPPLRVAGRRADVRYRRLTTDQNAVRLDGLFAPAVCPCGGLCIDACGDAADSQGDEDDASCRHCVSSVVELESVDIRSARSVPRTARGTVKRSAKHEAAVYRGSPVEPMNATGIKTSYSQCRSVGEANDRDPRFRSDSCGPERARLAKSASCRPDCAQRKGRDSFVRSGKRMACSLLNRREGPSISHSSSEIETLDSGCHMSVDVRADDDRVVRAARSDPCHHDGPAFGRGGHSNDARVRRLFGRDRHRQPGHRALYRGMADRRRPAPAPAVRHVQPLGHADRRRDRSLHASSSRSPHETRGLDFVEEVRASTP